MKDQRVQIQKMHEQWFVHSRRDWAQDLKWYLDFASECIHRAELLLAYDVLSEAMEVFPGNLAIKKNFSLVLNRMEMSDEAKNLLLDLVHESGEDEEILGVLASAYKNLAKKTVINGIEGERWRDDNFNLSLEFYNKAYLKSRNVWHGINLATMQLIMGNEEVAQAMAKEVFRELFNKAQKSVISEYFDLATLGEALLILRDYDEAMSYFKRAVDCSNNDIGSQVSTKKNISLLHDCHKIPVGIYKKICDIFSIPKVVVFSGHMIDKDEENECRFPAFLENEVRDLIAKKIQTFGDIETYSSAACGADIIFIEESLKRRARINIILPCKRELFCLKSVNYLEGTSWQQRFDKILESDVNIIELTNISDDQLEIPYDFANQLILGLSRMQAKYLNTELISFVVYNKNSREIDGGTASVVTNLKKQQLPIEMIELDHLIKGKKSRVHVRGNDQLITDKRYKYPGYTAGLLYADTVNYSKLSDFEMMILGQTVSEWLDKMLKEKKYRVGEKNTWGDAFFISFYDIKDAGECALMMMDFINNFRWSDVGINKKIEIRLALHAGVVYSYNNPLTNSLTFNGINVCRAARMESITPPGRVFCSQEFAAFSEALNNKDFVCSYVGQKLMPKHFGKFPTYLVRRF